METNAIIVQTLRGKDDFNDFLRLPWKVYRNDPYWVPPLLRDIKSMFDRRKNPFGEHAQIELFLARENGEAVGRIVATIDENHNKFHQEKTGFFGLFECLPDYAIADSLLTEAKRWCQEKCMNLLRGPMNLSMNDECAFLLEGFDSSPAIMMPYNPKYYLEFMERYGFGKAKDLYASLKSEVGVPQRIAKLVERVKRKEKVVVRPIDMKHLQEEVKIIKEIYNFAWEKNWGFALISLRD